MKADLDCLQEMAKGLQRKELSLFVSSNKFSNLCTYLERILQ